METLRQAAKGPYGQGLRLEANGQFKAAREAYAVALAQDGNALPTDWELLQSQPRALVHRMIMVRFVKAHLPRIRHEASSLPVTAGHWSDRTWVYWGQGVEVAPPIVRRCRDDLLSIHEEPGIVVELDDRSLRNWISVPDDLSPALFKSRTRLSDYVRLALLSRYGGVWLDSTCLVTSSVEGFLNPLMESGFFAFCYHDARIANWFLACTPGHWITRMMLAGHNAYWRNPKIDVRYFWFHDMFEALYLLDSQFKDAWDSTPKLDPRPSRKLEKSWRENLTRGEIEAIVNTQPIHKLTYKVNTDDLGPQAAYWFLVGNAPPVKAGMPHVSSSADVTPQRARGGVVRLTRRIRRFAATLAWRFTYLRRAMKSLMWKLRGR